MDMHKTLALKEKIRLEKVHERYLKARCNLTLDQYTTVSERQKGLCFICQKIPEKKLEVDINKTSRKPRGLLCHRCVMAVGLFRENPALLIRAAQYLQNFIDNNPKE